MQQPSLLLPQNEDTKMLQNSRTNLVAHSSIVPATVPLSPYFSLLWDPLSITASIVAVLRLTSIVIEYYASSVKDSSKDRVQCANEALNLYNLLF